MAKQKLSIQVLTELQWEHDCSGTKMPKDYVPKRLFTDKTANGLTKCVIAWLSLNGWQAERISNTGRWIDDSKIVTDVMGHRKKIGSGKYIPGTGTKGTSDISSIIKGRSVKIEIKIGKDKQSESQKKYESDVIKSGGIYLIVTDFDQFMMWYKSFIESII